MVDIATAIKNLYPTADFRMGGNVRVEETPDQGQRITYWHPSLGAQPTESSLASYVLTATQVKSQSKVSALAVATAAGFTLDQLRIIRAVVLLLTGTAPQKAKAQALLMPLIQLCNDAKSAAAAIDADAVPLPIVPPILGTDDP